MNLFAAETRRIHQLDETSWIQHIPGWLGREHAKKLLAKLIANAAWEQRDRWMVNRRVIEPRLTAEYTDLADAPDPVLREAADALSAHYQVSYDGLWINFYRDHRDSTGWHGDWPTCKRPECIVPVVSLGAPRRFLIKPRPGGQSIGLTPESGDLSVMGGRAQRDWLHSVPKQARPAGARVSVNFSSGFQAIDPRHRPRLPGLAQRAFGDPARESQELLAPHVTLCDRSRRSVDDPYPPFYTETRRAGAARDAYRSGFSVRDMQSAQPGDVQLVTGRQRFMRPLTITRLPTPPGPCSVVIVRTSTGRAATAVPVDAPVPGEIATRSFRSFAGSRAAVPKLTRKFL